MPPHAGQYASLEFRYYHFGGETAVLSKFPAVLHKVPKSALDPNTVHFFLSDSPLKNTFIFFKPVTETCI
jgi:adenylate cyclase